MSNHIVAISIIIPCFNVEKKISNCLNSLKKINFPMEQYEVIFVDDHSSDKTLTILQSEIKHQNNWYVHPLDKNSGSPSKPRNEGVKLAKGEYIFYLDSDDEILPNALQLQYDIAQKENACIVRGNLIVHENGQQHTTNQIIHFSNSMNKQTKIKQIIKNQSTTVPSLIKRELLQNYNITWDENLRMGEDTLYLIDVLTHSEHISYIDQPLFIYHKTLTENASSTQIYGARELRNHLHVWQEAQKKLSTLDINYIQIRGQVALQTALQSLLKFYQGDIDRELFKTFSQFINQHWEIIKNFKYNKTLKEALEYLKSEQYENFFDMLKPHLLIAGDDLKFIKGVIPELEKKYSIKIDQWKGHNSHNEKKSLELLQWADIIFCEWLLGNAVWYSHHKLSHQKLFIRLHRFELTRDFGHKIDDSNVDGYCTVGLYTLEKMIETFGYDRSKVHLIPNYIDTTKYETSQNEEKVYNLGIVGILPSRKGYLNALKILKILKEKSPKYNLSVFGQMANEVSWIKNDPNEMEYFKECDRFIEEEDLSNSITIKGWVDTKSALKNIGFILSVSQTGELPESFHIAPAEGFAAGNQGVFLHWDGVEYIYPKKYVFHTIDNIADYIYNNKELDTFNKNKKEGKTHIFEHYSVQKFINSLTLILVK